MKNLVGEPCHNSQCLYRTTSPANSPATRRSPRQHSLEKECLCLLLWGEQQVVVCPAWSVVGMRIPVVWHPALDTEQMLNVSPFPAARRRPTSALSAERNDLAVRLDSRVSVAHASSGNRTEALARRAAPSSQSLLTMYSPPNTNLRDIGAETVSANDLATLTCLERLEQRKTGA